MRARRSTSPVKSGARVALAGVSSRSSPRRTLHAGRQGASPIYFCEAGRGGIGVVGVGKPLILEGRSAATAGLALAASGSCISHAASPLSEVERRWRDSAHSIAVGT